MTGRQRAAGGPSSPTGISGKNSGLANLKPFKPGVSGNWSGRPAGDGLVRKLILEAFRKSRADAVRAIQMRLKNPKYVQDVLELLARLQGELSKQGAEAGRGVVDVILLNNQGSEPLDPETFRQRVLEQRGLEMRSSRPEADGQTN